jgi:hypothetical protein
MKHTSMLSSASIHEHPPLEQGSSGRQEGAVKGEEEDDDGKDVERGRGREC